MLDIASRREMEDKTLIEYIIRIINDEGTNKSILYGARDMYELKQRLSIYEDMKRDTENIKNKQKNKRCYNCGDRDHLSTSCPAKEKGAKCD